MHPEPEARQAASQILKTTFFTVALTACHYYEPQTTIALSRFNCTLPDGTVKATKSVLPKKKTKTIYLTFDDGPNKGTKKLMNIVDEEKLMVTVFIVGEHVYGSKEQTATFDSLLANRYVEIANHSYTHAFNNKYAKFYTVPDSAVHDFMRCADSLQLKTNIIRLPGRNIWRTANINCTDIAGTKAAADSLYKDGFTEVGWDLEWHYDAALNLKNKSDDMVLQIDSMFVNNKTKTLNHLVLLAHDQVYADASDSTELHQFFKKLKAKNEYNFEVVSRYPALKKTD